MSVVNAIINSLGRVGPTVRAQVAAGFTLEHALINMFGSFKDQIEQLTVDPHSQNVERLTTAVTSGPWNAEQKLELATLISNAGARSARPTKNATAVSTSGAIISKTC